VESSDPTRIILDRLLGRAIYAKMIAARDNNPWLRYILLTQEEQNFLRIGPHTKDRIIGGLVIITPEEISLPEGI
jgi:hypothetical protein